MGYWGAIIQRGGYAPQGINGTWLSAGADRQLMGSKFITGALFNAMVMTDSIANNSQVFIPEIELDGLKILPYAGWSFEHFNTNGFDKTTTPISLINYAVDGLNIINYSFPWGLKINEYIALYVRDKTGAVGNDVNFKSYYYIEEY